MLSQFESDFFIGLHFPLDLKCFLMHVACLTKLFQHFRWDLVVQSKSVFIQMFLWIKLPENFKLTNCDCIISLLNILKRTNLTWPDLTRLHWIPLTHASHQINQFFNIQLQKKKWCKNKDNFLVKYNYFNMYTESETSMISRTTYR